MPFFNPGMNGNLPRGPQGNWTWGQNHQGNWTRGQWGQGNWTNGNQNWPPNNPGQTPNWNQIGGPSFNATLTLTAQVTNDTANGGIMWTIQSGSIIENGTTLTITNGQGGIGKLDRILMGGNVTDSNGHTYRWMLQGLATMYDGTVIASLDGGCTYNPNPLMSTSSQQAPGTVTQRLWGVRLSFITTLT